MMETRTQLIDDILDMELKMFLAVRSDCQSMCQLHPDRFKFHRSLQFSVWSDSTLSTYREDLRQAIRNDENLMTIKYARMQGLVPPRKTHPLIDAILKIEMDWQDVMIRRYPAIMGSARPLAGDSDNQWRISFETYARGELETYSAATLISLHADLQGMLARGINASEQIYRLQAERSGFSSLESAEAHTRQQMKKNGKKV